MRKTLILASCILAGALMNFSAYADVISDAPVEIGAAPVGETAAAASGVSEAVSEVISEGSAASGSTGYTEVDISALGDLPAAVFSMPADEGAARETVSAQMPGDMQETVVSEETAPVMESAAPVMESAAPAMESKAPEDNGEIISEASYAPESADTPVPVSGDAAGEEYSAPVEYITIGGSESESLTGPSMITSGGSGDESGPAAGSGDGQIGSRYVAAPTTRVDLGYTLISPSIDYNGFRVAEGSAQLADGSWENVGKDRYIRNRYYKLISEQTDSTGTGWYVVAAGGRQVGNYRTSDGSVLSEIWLKKSDCTAQSYIELNTTNPTRQKIVRDALSYLGKRYQFAANGPDAFDCSGFVHYIMGLSGISVPRTSTELCQAGTQVGIEGLRPGDIVGRSGHVGIYIGDGWFVHASESSTGVITESIEVYNRTNHFTNYVNVVGD